MRLPGLRRAGAVFGGPGLAAPDPRRIAGVPPAKWEYF